MAAELLLDNDVLVKLTRWGLAPGFLHHCCDSRCTDPVAVLATAAWVCKGALRRAISACGEDPAILTSFEQLLADLVQVEPEILEIELAALLEDQAARLGEPLDPGESLLAAVAAQRRGILLTGDKRAIAALERLHQAGADLEVLSGRVASLEHAIMSLLVHLDVAEVRQAVQSAPAADVAMRLAFSSTHPEQILEGLNSFIGSIRLTAPVMLIQADSMCFCEIELSLEETPHMGI